MHSNRNRRQKQERADRWSWRKQILTTIPIFLILIGVLSLVSRATSVPWNNNPMNRTLEAVQGNTSVTMQPTATSDHCSSAPVTEQSGMCAVSPTAGAYKVATKITSYVATEKSTGAKQRITLMLHYPIGFKGKMPGILFMHGAGDGSATASYQDMADDLASAGFMAATVDKPVFHTGPITRDYPAMADAYDQALRIVRARSDVNPNKVGIFATSESGWVAPLVIDRDSKVAFQILLSPMLFTPRVTVGFFAAQDVSILGANPGYQGMIRRILSSDFTVFNLKNADINPFNSKSFAIPTYLAYGSKDVMTSQVDGAMKVMEMAQKAGNSNFVIRDYPLADHILRLGDGSSTAIVLADHYLEDTTDWAAGIVKGYAQVAPRVGGHDIYQSIALPKITPSPALSWYFIILNAAMLLAVATLIIFTLIVLVRKIWALLHKRRDPIVFANGFGKAMLFNVVVTVLSLALFVAAIFQIVQRVSWLAWGRAPVQPAGMIYWSWYALQLATAVVVWSWSRIFAVFIEAGSKRGWFKWIKRIDRSKPAEPVQGAFVNGGKISYDVVPFADGLRKRRHDPVFATTKMGLAYFITITVTMFLILLIFAYWGLFLY